MSGLKIFVTATSETDLAVDACQPLPRGTPDLSQFLVLTRRGTCLITDKLTNLENAGAKVILYPHSRIRVNISIQNTPTNVILPLPVTNKSVRNFVFLSLA